MKTLREEIDLSISEAVFQSLVIQLAHIHGWRVAHFRTGIGTQGRYMTPVQADGAGFLDLIMVRGDRLIIAELKAEQGKMREEQKIWFDALYPTAAEVFIWKPRDWTAINAALARPIKGVSNG